MAMTYCCRHIQAHASSCSESGMAGSTIRQSFCSALQAEVAEFYRLMAVLQEQSMREAPKPSNLSTGRSRSVSVSVQFLDPSSHTNGIVQVHFRIYVISYPNRYICTALVCGETALQTWHCMCVYSVSYATLSVVFFASQSKVDHLSCTFHRSSRGSSAVVSLDRG